MNLYTYSEVNNYEIGVLLKHRSDRKAFNDCMEEIEILIKAAQPVRVKEGFQQKQHFDYEELSKAWHKYIQDEYPKTTFMEREHDYIEAKNFPIWSVNFSTQYGFATFIFTNSVTEWEISNDQKEHIKHKVLRDYRIYWKSDRVHLYPGKSTDFNKLSEAINYRKKGLEKLMEVIKENMM